MLVALSSAWRSPASAAIAVDPSAGPNAPGSMILEWSTPIDLSILTNGLVVEQLQPDRGWVELPGDQVVVGTRPGAEDSGEILVMLRSGWPRGMSYRIRLGPEIADRLGRPLARSHEIQWSVPASTPEDPVPKVAHDETFPPEFDSAEAAADTVGGRFPGGQPRLFQGLLHDPVTGLAYARNRWYDPRNAAWLSEDPLGAVDSPNLYGFVGWQPTMGTDPLGLYQADLHLGMTEFLARKAGFSELHARVIGRLARRPDVDHRDPLANGKVLYRPELFPKSREHEAARRMRRWHFPLTCEEAETPQTCAVVPSSSAALQEVKAGIDQGSLRRFAEGLHVLQDSYSHQGTPAWFYFDEEEGLLAGFGHPEDRGGGYSSDADLPPEYPDDAIAAARATFEALLQWRTESEGLSKKEARELGNRFRGEIRAQVEEWVTLSKEERREWLEERRIFVEEE